MDSLNAIVEMHHTHFSDVYAPLDKKCTDMKFQEMKISPSW